MDTLFAMLAAEGYGASPAGYSRPPKNPFGHQRHQTMPQLTTEESVTQDLNNRDIVVDNIIEFTTNVPNTKIEGIPVQPVQAESDSSKTKTKTQEDQAPFFLTEQLEQIDQDLNEEKNRRSRAQKRGLCEPRSERES